MSETAYTDITTPNPNYLYGTTGPTAVTTPAPDLEPQPTTRDHINQLLAATAQLAERTNNLNHNHELDNTTRAAINAVLADTTTQITNATAQINSHYPTE